MAAFTLPDKNSGIATTFDRTRFYQAADQWVNNNNHEYVDAADYSNLNWTPGIDKPEEIFLSSKVSLPATNTAGKSLLKTANTFANKHNTQIRVNGMARPQAIQDYMRQQPTMMGVVARRSIHRAGAIDFAYVDGPNGTLTQQFKKYMKNKGYKVVDHAGHIHVSP